ncbi:hypothetical protein HZQ11_18400 [Elizabethkingia anophelis]|uniref:hypothetical protein n=1 Tax=Elizabethkingia TaxID=308865 RepID=UPI0007398910|nr:MULTISPECIES: hypothetical protein [Elizabethkingia]KUF40216.1 hypothetical protein AS358_01755 [Elizabethkingia anophelis]MCT3644368.1 hypothetical protein [Elizabethkingia anophelis]MCT3653633.1 hypothetical protein [Elizabethkingia anophelis]MCT3657259.1 hypothetical protein [Elizabethkingia anophelis]MCT3658140.1 hypothetical protein [Elizabethkingia anophelis]
MKKISILLLTLPGLYFAQLAAPQGQMLATEKPNTGFVGIGTTNPISNLEIASPTATLTLSTNQADGNQENPLLPKIDFLGYANWPKARIAAAERSYNTYGSKLSFFVNDGTGATNLKEMMTINQDSRVGIGTTNPQYKLDVNGSFRAGLDNYFSYNGGADIFLRYLGRGSGGRAIVHDISNTLTLNYANDFTGGTLLGTSFLVKGDNAMLAGKLEAKEIKVTTTPTADFVFEDSYQLPNLESVEKHIKEKKHLPEIASASEMQKDGVNIGDFQIKLLQKIEELTLYSIEQNKLIKEQQERLKKLEEKQNIKP